YRVIWATQGRLHRDSCAVRCSARRHATRRRRVGRRLLQHADCAQPQRQSGVTRMRAILEVIQFELRYQLRSPFFLGALLLFALIHFLSITGTGIHLDISNQVAINSTFGICQSELVLFGFGILPIVAFVTTAITRDFEHATASLVFVTPISPKKFVLGRFLGALSLAFLIGLAGLLGTMIGTLMPWLDQERIAPFTLLPWAYMFLVVLLPGTLVLCAIFFSVA